MTGHDFAAEQRTLKRMKKSRDVEGLTASLESSTRLGDLSIRATAARYLGDVGDKQAVRPLTQLVSDDDQLVRTYAAIGLGNLGSADAVPVLISLVRDENPIVAFRAVESLARLRALDAAPHLIELLRSPDWRMRRLAAEALATIGDRSAAPDVRAAAERETKWLRRRPIIRAAQRLGA